MRPMDFGSWLLVTSTLVPAPQAPTPAIVPSVQVTFDQRQVDRQRKPAAPRPHQFGLGTNVTAGNRGVGGSFRYWFTDRIGLDAGVRWYLGQRLPTGERPSTFQTSPSLLFMLTEPHPDREIDLRPYVGGGFNYVNASGRIPNTTTPSGAASSSDRSGGRRTAAGITFCCLRTTSGRSINLLIDQSIN